MPCCLDTSQPRHRLTMLNQSKPLNVMLAEKEKSCAPPTSAGVASHEQSEDMGSLAETSNSPSFRGGATRAGCLH
jgi:hypothetical protein